MKRFLVYLMVLSMCLVSLSGCVVSTADKTDNIKLSDAADKTDWLSSYDGLIRYDDNWFDRFTMNFGGTLQFANIGAKTFEDTASVAAPSMAAPEAVDESVISPLEGATLEEATDFSTAEFRSIEENGFVNALTSPLSTFGADVDTASYCFVRQSIYDIADAIRSENVNSENAAEYYTTLDPQSVRVEEVLNYFDYDYEKPSGDDKFTVNTEVARSPWNDNLILRIGIRAAEYDRKSAGSNVVLLVDTSGSMFDSNKLPLVQKAIGILSDSFTENDRISLVTYAGLDTILLDSVPGNDKEQIMKAVDDLEAYGFTNGAAGINTAYELAAKNFIENGNNRVILMTDGDFNVGQTSESQLVSLIEEKRNNGVFLSVCGFGTDNYSDTRMEALADNGNGNYDYIDCSREAEKFFRNEFESTMYTVAKDVKFQVDFNPVMVKGYRQIGYENRQMAAEDFADDTKDGGEVGSGQTVTVLYELIPADSDTEIASVSSNYVKSDVSNDSKDYCTVHIRYKGPDSDKSTEVTQTVSELSDTMSPDMDFAVGVAQIVALLRESEYAGNFSYDDVIKRLGDVASDDNEKAEFLFLAKTLAKWEEMTEK